MKINHTIAQYTIGILALAGATYAINETSTSVPPTAEVREVPRAHTSKFDWPDLTQQETEDLGELLNTLNPEQNKHITIFCNISACQNFRADIDGAFQIGWWTHDWEDVYVESEHEQGISVGPPGEDAEAVKAAIEKVTNYPVQIVPIHDIPGVGIIIGKHGEND